MIKKEAETILKCKHLTYNTNSAHVEFKIRSDTSNNRGNWYNLKITQTKTLAANRQSIIPSNYSKQPYCALHTYRGKC